MVKKKKEREERKYFGIILIKQMFHNKLTIWQSVFRLAEAKLSVTIKVMSE